MSAPYRGYAGGMAAAGGRGSRGTGKGRDPRSKGGARAAPSRSASPAGRSGKAGAGGSAAARAGKRQPTADAGSPAPAGRFRLGAIEGATPGTWIDTWRERMPHAPLELVPLGVFNQRAALTSASVDAALVRLPIDRAGLHVIPLYDEVPVVVCAADSHLTAAGELTVADLAGEVVIVPEDPPLELEVPNALAPRFARPATVADAIATVAAGVGVVIVPMSLARLHHRRDTAFRPLSGGPASPVALAWPARADGQTSPLVEAFIGIVRGRTENSSRNSSR
ncbi:MAG: LysR substrate-binding domain-containing protein [Microbacterium sp.]